MARLPLIGLLPDSDPVPGGVCDHGDEEVAFGVALRFDHPALGDHLFGHRVYIGHVYIGDDARASGNREVTPEVADYVPAAVREAGVLSFQIDVPPEDRAIESRRRLGFRCRDLQVGDPSNPEDAHVSILSEP
jgi:hypothetical protein